MAPNIAAAADARVIQNAFGLQVVPRDVFKHTGDTFTILNISQVTVFVSFPENFPTNPASAAIPAGGTASFAIQNPAPGAYDYFVDVALNDTRSNTAFTLRASGGSDPRIIIDF